MQVISWAQTLAPPLSAQVSALPGLPSYLKNATPPQGAPKAALPFPVKPPSPPCLIPLGMAKPCRWGIWERKEFWGLVTQPPVLALLTAPSYLTRQAN